MKPPSSPIKVRLQASPSEAPRDEAPFAENHSASQPPEVPPESAAFASLARSSVNFSKVRQGRWLNHPILAAGLVSTAVIMLGWSLVFRLGDMTSKVSVEARMLTGRPLPELPERPLSVESVEQLKLQIQQSRARLVQGERGLVRLMAELEQIGLTHGWRVDAKVETAVTNASAFPPIRRYPIDVRLADASDSAARPGSAYHRLIAFMTEVHGLEKKVDLHSLHAQAGQEGIQTARLQLMAWTEVPDESAIPK